MVSNFCCQKTAEKAVSGSRFLLLKNSRVGHCDCDIAVDERQQSGAFLSSSVISVPTRAKRMISWECFLSLQRSKKEYIILEGVPSV